MGVQKVVRAVDEGWVEETVLNREEHGLQTAPETDWLMFKKIFLILESIKDL